MLISTSDFFANLSYYLSFPFVRYALIVSTLIALCASLLGVTLVLKRYSFIGDGLSHVAFGAIAIASVFNLTNNVWIVLPITIVAAVFILRSSRNTKVRGDAAIAMTSVSALALGYLLINVFSTSANVSGDVCSTLFGSTSLLTLTKGDVIFTVVLSSVVIITFVIMYNRIFAITFDENFAKASGMKTERYNLLIAIIIALIIVLGMKLVGSLLISALIVFPTLSAMRLIDNFKGVVICSGVTSVVCAFVGMILSMCFETPAGATIVAANLVVYLGFTIVSRIRGR